MPANKKDVIVSDKDIKAEGKVRDFDQMQLTELGRTGLSRWGGDIYEEFMANLRWPRAAKVYQEMADNDPTVGAILYMAQQLIRKLPWEVVPSDEQNAEAVANAQFLEECMHDMSISWNDTISEILSYFTYGWSFHEVVFKIRRGPLEKDPKYRSKYADGKIGWRKIPVRSQHTLHAWLFDEADGGIIGFQQQAPPDFKLRTIPLHKGLLFRSVTTRDNPEGKSLLRNAYRPWYFKKRIEEVEGIGIERDLAGLPVLIPPENTDLWSAENPEAKRLRSMAENLVKNVRRDKSEGVVIPNGWEFKLISTGGNRQFDTNAIINRYDQRIAITMLSDIVMLGADKVGSFALAAVKKSLLADALQAQVNNIADVFNNYALPTLFRFNGITDPAVIPKIVPGDIVLPEIKELGEYIKATGIKIPQGSELEKYLLKLAHLPIKSSQEIGELLVEEQGDAPVGFSDAEPETPEDFENSEDFETLEKFKAGGILNES